MAKFQFALEKVLRWRSLELAGEEAKLEKLLAAHRRLETKRAALEAEKSSVERSPESLPSLSGSDLKILTIYRQRLMRQAESLQDQLAESAGEIREQRDRYRKAKQRVRLLEELRERQWQSWRTEQDREFDRLADESHIATWNSKLARHKRGESPEPVGRGR